MFYTRLVLWFIICTYSVTWARVSIDNDGGLINVVIGINPQLKESNIERVLHQLETLFKDASKILLKASRGQTFFKEVVFALPKKYRSALSGVRWTTEGDYFKNPDIVVTSEDVFRTPYALQNAGCGRPGLRIHLPEEFLSGTETGKAKALVQEWAKYRYGVFNENGFVGDDLYPACYTIPGSEQMRVTDCTDKEVLYDFKRQLKEFPEACNPTPVQGTNVNVISSFLSKMDLPQASQFCDDELYPHNKNAPSKQNALCQEQSTWKIISQHQDFKFKPIRKSKTVTELIRFKYVIEPDFRLILAVDTSTDMAENDKLDMVGNAFSYFVLYSLPENSVVGIKNLMKENNPLLVTLRTPADADRLIDAFPEAYGKEDICLHCGIEQALQALNTTSGISQGQIVIAAATDIEPSRVESIRNSLDKNQASLHVLYFSRKLRDAPRIQKLSEASGGKFFYIPDELGAGGISHLTMIYESFRTIYESYSWLNRNHVLVEQKTFPKETCTTCTLTFQSDHSMDSFQVLLTGPKFVVGPPVIKDKTILSNGNQKFKPGHSSFSYKIKIPAYVFSIKNPKPGTWSLTFERKPEFHKPLVVIVRSSSMRDVNILNMHSWIDIEDNFRGGATLTRPPITLYSEIRHGVSPAFNATVSATLYNTDSGEETTLDLYDGADGDPDITGKDGIFSRYLTKAPQSGYYILTVTAEYNSPWTQFRISNQGSKAYSCCGSSYPSHLTYDAGPFKRTATLGSFFVAEQNVGLRLPPRRIRDLRVDQTVLLNGNKIVFLLQWTSPGNNYDSGTAIDYQMRIFKERDDAYVKFDTAYVLAIDNFHVHGRQLLEPSEAGSSESVIIELKNLTSGTYYLAMRTMNFHGDLSETSNVVEVIHNETSVPSTTSITDDLDPLTDPTSKDDLTASESNFRLALGLACGVLALCIVIGIFVLVYCGRLRRDRRAEEAKRQEVISRYGGAPFCNGEVQKTESCDALCQSTNNMNISVISPIHSWPADSLLAHYETMKRNKTSDSSETSTVNPKDHSDTTSVASSKYSYINKIDQNSSLYDPIYFAPQDTHNNYSYPIPDRGNMNHPYNPTYLPFNPAYTSSLRRDHVPRTIGHGYSTNSIPYSNYSLEGSSVQRLATDL